MSSRRDTVTGGFGCRLSAFLACGRDFNRSCSRVSFAATVTEMWQAGQDSLVLFAGCGQQGDCAG
ncbi:MAG TPA: hypothetical protein VHT28_03505 [Silvibacterium sp.]|nr:hypothetical protein [Silvibacterium sp.]